MVRFIALICLGLGITVQLASAQSSPNKGEARCATGDMSLSNLNALKLSEGENVVGMLETEVGKLEARVTVKNGEVSDPVYYLRDKRLEKTPDAKVPKSILACPHRGKESLNDRTLLGKLANVIVLPAEAKGCIAKVKSVACDDIDLCCAVACCGSTCARWCAKY